MLYKRENAEFLLVMSKMYVLDIIICTITNMESKKKK